MSHDLHDLDIDSIQILQSHSERQQPVPATPNKRTRSLGLQDKQWDALFSSPVPNKNSKSKEGRKDSTNREKEIKSNLEQAHIVASAKLHANMQQQQQRGRSHKRKRSGSGSRDDIFRTKKPEKVVPINLNNPLSRFLSSHPVIAHSLCFATPVRDSADTDHVSPSVSTVISEANSNNNNSTAEDTMTSTVYYETTKLAGLFQRSPPMPLFTNYCLDERDDIQKLFMSLQQAQRQRKSCMDDDDDGGHIRVDSVKAASIAPKTDALKGPKAVEQAQPVVSAYYSSSNSSEASKGIQRTSKIARQSEK
jgi:hypothetical protein